MNLAPSSRGLYYVRALFVALCIVAPTVAQSLVNGGSVSGTIGTPGQQDRFRFRAQAGESYLLRLIDVNNTSFRPLLRVMDSSGNLIVQDSDPEVASIQRSATLTDNYEVVVADGNSMPQTGQYSVEFAKMPGANEGGSLPNGGAANDRIDRGDVDTYTFSIDAGENYHLRFVDTTGTGLFPFMILYDPTGAVVAQDADQDVASLFGAATMSGTYTVAVLDGNSSPSQTGDYRLYYARAPGASSGGALTSGRSVTGNIDLGALDSYSFAIAAGESYQLRIADNIGTGLFVFARLFDPRGCFVAQDSDPDVAQLGGDAEFSGTYTLVVTDGNSSPTQTGAYTLHYAKAPGSTSGGVLPNGGAATGSIALGALESFTFDIDAGQTYVLRAIDTVGTRLFMFMRLYDPRGCFVTQDADQDVASLIGTAEFSGSYTVILADGNSSPSGTGPYRIEFASVPGARPSGPLLNGGVVRGSIDKGEIETFTFEATAGEGYLLRAVDTVGSAFVPDLRVYDPRGEFLLRDVRATVSTVVGSARITGTYTAVLLDGNSSPMQTGPFEIHFTRAPGANEGGYLLDGQTANGAIDVGDVDSYTVRARAGERVQITMTDTLGGSLAPTLRFYNPNGVLSSSTGATTTAVLNSNIQVDGTHTIVAYDGSSNATGAGPYTLTVTGAGRAGNAGCALEGTPILSGAISARAGFSITPPSFTQPCSGQPFVLLGTCPPGPIPLPSSLSCGSCGLDILRTLVVRQGRLSVAPLPASAVGSELCAQAACIAGACVSLSASSRLTVVE